MDAMGFLKIRSHLASNAVISHDPRGPVVIEVNFCLEDGGNNMTKTVA